MRCHTLTPARITPPRLIHPRAFLRSSPRASKKSHLFYCPQLPDFTFSYHPTPPPPLPLSYDGPNSPCRPEGDKGWGGKSAKLEMMIKDLLRAKDWMQKRVLRPYGEKTDYRGVEAWDKKKKWREGSQYPLEWGPKVSNWKTEEIGAEGWGTRHEGLKVH